MTHRWNRINRDNPNSRTIHCTVVETPAISDPLTVRRTEGFRDLVPWADPYITALIEKLRRTDDWSADERSSDDRNRDEWSDSDGRLSSELPPPLDSDSPGRGGRADSWRPRNWPHG